MDDGHTTPADKTKHPFAQVPVEITVSVGRARPMLCDLLQLGPDAVLPLDRRVEDPVDLYIGDRLIARGTLEEAEDDPERLAVRVFEIAELEDRP